MGTGPPDADGSAEAEHRRGPGRDGDADRADEARLLQVGWRVLSRDGHELGEVSGFDTGTVVVTAHGASGDRLVIPLHYVARELETETRAILSVDEREARAFVVER